VAQRKRDSTAEVPRGTGSANAFSHLCSASPRLRVPTPSIAPSGGSIPLLEDECHHRSAGIAGSRIRDSDTRDFLPV
jgi:hypothetical protein